MAWQVPTYWSCGVRRREGMTLIRAFVRNLRTWLAMVRKRHKWKTHEAESTNAPTRVALLNSSEEAEKCPWSEGGRSPTSGWSQRATGGTPCPGGSRQASSWGGTSRMNCEVHVRICGGLGVKFPGSTRPLDHVMWGLERRVQTNLLMTYRNTTRMTSKPELVTCSGNSVLNSSEEAE